MIIQQARLVRTGDTAEFAWTNLRRFQNVSFVENEIVRLHGLESRQRQNARKQAQQLRFCLTQAREYAIAAAAVSLATKPTLLYYSLMSLALAEILLKQTGESSLDRAREQHRHHGLIFKYQSSPAIDGKSLFDAAADFTARPMEGSDGRIGTFNLWHKSCREMPLVGNHTDYLPTGEAASCQVLLTPSDLPLSEIPDKGLTLLNCLLAIPGMMDHLALHQINSETLRVKITRSTFHRETPIRLVTGLTVHPSPNANEFLNNILIDAKAVDKVNFVELPSGGHVSFIGDYLYGPYYFNIPHGSSWTKEEVRCWTNSRPLNEFGYLYMALFIAGNYARYYPDKWLQDVETCSPLALAIEELLSVAEQRMVWLSLSELSRVCFVPE